MEKVIQRKEQSKYLSLIVKKISKDRLTLRESDNYILLKVKIDPMGHLEEELNEAWKKAEEQNIGEKFSSGNLKWRRLSILSGIGDNFTRLFQSDRVWRG